MATTYTTKSKFYNLLLLYGCRLANIGHFGIPESLLIIIIIHDVETVVEIATTTTKKKTLNTLKTDMRYQTTMKETNQFFVDQMCVEMDR